MSFFDDASLVFLPSGEAGKDGKAYSMKPVPEYGNELITNGGFDTDSDWVKVNSTISGGTGNLNGTGVTSLLYQSNVLTQNKKYYLSFTISNYNGLGQLEVINNNGTSYYLATSNGNISIEFTHSIANQNFLFRAKNNAIASIDNVSVKEVIVGDGDFTFSRGSNLTATRVDSNGLIEKGRENLLLQSNQFDTTWGSVNTTETSGQAGYDGSSDAWLLTITASGAYLYQDKAVSGVQTFSFFAKEETLARVNVVVNASVNVTAQFDLANGIVLGGSQNITSSITSVGDGWYRCSVTYNQGTTSRFRLYPVNLAGGGTSGSIYIQDAQLEIGLAATEPILSGASTGKAGLLEDSPRFDYSGGASCPSLLLEPSRTNYLGYSEYFDGWNLFNNMTPTANDAISPEGFQNAYKMETTNVGAYFRDAETLTAGDNVFSIFVKRGNSQYIFLRTRFFTGGEEADVWFDVQSGTKGGNLGASVTYDIEDYGNGWYRCYLVHNVDAGDLFGYAYVGLTNTDEDVAGESGLNGYFYGGQWEEGSYPTSYIPNHSGGSVTRETDDLNDLSVSVNNEGTFYFETKDRIFENESSNKNYLGLIESSSGNYFRFRGASSVILIQSIGFGSNISFNPSGASLTKYLYKWDGTTIKVFVDGVERGSVSQTARFEPDTFRKAGGGSITSASNLKQLLIFTTALSDAECITLTS